MINETETSVAVSIQISFNRQSLWYPDSYSYALQWRFYAVPFLYQQHDPTRIHWGDTVALGHLHANDFVIGAGSSLISTLTKSQIVTATKELNADSNKFFIIREPLPVVPNGIPTSAHTSPHEMSPLIGDSSFQLSSRLTKPKPAGTAITCNSTIRLLHARTGKYLSSYFDAVPDSQEQEVHLNGDKAIGDTHDNWVVLCEPNTKHGYSYKWDYIQNGFKHFEYNLPFHRERIQWVLNHNNIYWRPSTVIRLFHPNSNKYLTFNNIDITSKACRQCYKRKQKQITATEQLIRGDQQRFQVKRQTRVPIECASNELLSMRWQTANRLIRVGDYVVWRNASRVPCDAAGSFRVHQNFEMDTRFGKVLEVYTESAMIYVEEYMERTNIYSKTARHYTSTLWKATHALSISAVHGPLVVVAVQTDARALLHHRIWVKAILEEQLDGTMQGVQRWPEDVLIMK